MTPMKTAMASGLTEEELTDILSNKPFSMFLGLPLVVDMETFQI